MAVNNIAMALPRPNDETDPVLADWEWRRKLAAALAERSQGSEPIQHWSQGAAKLMHGLAGVYQRNRLRGEQKQAMDEAAGLWSGLVPRSAPAAPSSVARDAASAGGPPIDMAKGADGSFSMPQNLRPAIARMLSGGAGEGDFSGTPEMMPGVGVEMPMEQPFTQTGQQAVGPTSGDMYRKAQEMWPWAQSEAGGTAPNQNPIPNDLRPLIARELSSVSPDAIAGGTVSSVPPPEVKQVQTRQQIVAELTGEVPDFRGRGGPASIRFNNPGAQYPGPSAGRFGTTGTEVIGGGHKIAVFPDAVSGAAAQFDLLNRRYAGMPLQAAITRWSGGNSSAAYMQRVARETGLAPDTIITPELLQSPQGLQLAQSMAGMEAGRRYPMSDGQWGEAQKRAFGGGRPTQMAQAPTSGGGIGGVDQATMDKMLRNPHTRGFAQNLILQSMPAVGEKAQLERDNARSQIELRGAQTDYYRSRSAAAGQNADTRRLDAMAKVIRVMGPQPSRDLWEAENQEGGVIHTAFGGRIPFERAPYVLAQARNTMNQFEPTEEERQAGISREMKLDAFRQQKLDEIHGFKTEDRMKRGQRWNQQGSGLEMIPGGGTQSERNARTVAKFGLQQIETAIKGLDDANQLQEMAGDTWTVPGVGWKVGGFGNAGQAFRAAEGAIMDLTFALSGKQSSKAEQERFIKLYMPSSMDSASTQKQKLSTVKKYFTQSLRILEGGGSDDELHAAFQNALREGENPTTNVQPSNPTRDRLKQKYGLE